MTDESFKFYSVLKNEDAMPFAGGGLIIVADGLGGSGSAVHNIEAHDYADLRDEIFKSAFYDFDAYKAQPIASYLEYWVYPMADGVPDTSALWGSRITIARCAYALLCEDKFAYADLSDERVRRELSAFVTDGLERTAKHFGLKNGRYDDQKLLPSTLAFIRYKTEKNGGVTAEVVWAGDSRCYALTRDGLKQLSVDDEDKSGSITNLFCAGAKKPAVLNYRRYMLEAPCALLAVSDGVFEPFEPHDSFGAETVLLRLICGCNGYAELAEALKEYYGKIRSDDATMAFAQTGFCSYGDMRKAFAPRERFLAAIRDRLCGAGCALEVSAQTEDEARGYVVNRTADKLNSVISALLAAGEGDICYTGKIKAAVAEAVKECLARHTERALEELHAYLAEHTGEGVAGLLDGAYAANTDAAARSAADAAAREYEAFSKAARKRADLTAFKAEKEHWRGVIAERESFYWNSVNGLRGVDGDRAKALKYMRVWLSADEAFERGFKLYNYNDLEREDKKTAREIDAFIAQNKPMFYGAERIEAEARSAEGRYRAALEKLFALLKKDGAASVKMFNKATVKRFALDASFAEARVGADAVCERLSKDADGVISGIVGGLAENYGKTSAIDCFYNASRLAAFRQYYSLKNNPDNAVADLKNALDELEKAYVSLLR